MSLKQIFVRTTRTIGTIQLDAVLSEEHGSVVSITKNPVEAGADITDHAIVQPKKLSIRGVVSDSPLGLAAFGQLIDSVTRLFGTSTTDNLTRSQQAYEAMLFLMEQREPIEVTTGLRQYKNMLITSLNSVQDKNSSRIVVMELGLEEIVLVISVTKDIPAEALEPSVRQSASPIAEKGKEEISDVVDDKKTTVLKKMIDWVRGE